MKAFEEWWDKLCCIGDAEALKKHKSRYQTGFCNGYRMALEWALSQQGQIDWRFNPVILPKTIEKELGMKNENNQN